MFPPPLPERFDDRPIVAIFRSPLFNASENFVQAQAIGLARYQPLIVGLEYKGNVDPELADRLLLPSSRTEGIGLKVLGRATPLADRIRPFSPALMHAHFGPDGLLALPLSRALRIPLATTLHGYDVSRARRHMLMSGRISWTNYGVFKRLLTRSGELFLPVSDAVRRMAIGQGYPPERTFTHYIGVRLDRFASDDAGPRESGLILHVGRLVEKKGTAFLLDAFARLRQSRPDASLVIIGQGPLRAALERRSAVLGLGESVRFLGALAPEEVVAWMRRASVLAAPSITARDGDSEGLPTVLVEAAASFLPAIATDHSGIAEAIMDGETGFIVPECDVTALAERLLQILERSDLRDRMGRAARAFAETKFDSARQNRLLERHYDALLDPGGGGRQSRS